MSDINFGTRTLRFVVAIVVVVGLLAAVGPAAATDQTECGDGVFHDPSDRTAADARGEDAVRVDLVDLQPFSPATLVIDAGTCVNFVNPDTNALTHNVQIFADSSGELGHRVAENLAPGQNATWAFQETGTYHVNCDFNAFHAATMHQVVEVR